MDERIIKTEGDCNGHGLRFGIVASRFNDFIVDRLLSAAVDSLIKNGVDGSDIEIVRVPGAFETSLALQKLARGRNARRATGRERKQCHQNRRDE